MAFFPLFALVAVICRWIMLTDSRSLFQRQVIPERPAFITLSDGSAENYTLLKLAKGSSALLTDGPADSYDEFATPPQSALHGEFRVVDDNIFAPQNRGVRRYFETWVIGVIAVGAECLKASLDAPYLVLAPCQNGTLTEKS